MNPQTYEVLADLGGNVPRYTSYPTADRFHDGVGEAQYRAACSRGNRLPLPTRLSLYVHVPFCRQLCYYCGCNKIVTQDEAKAQPYLDALNKELGWHRKLFDSDRELDQIHFGGGTPTWLSDEALGLLMLNIGESFRLASGPEREFSIEIDPRTVDADRIRSLVEIGFNRFSLGVQDFDPAVQLAINREQSFESVADIVSAIRTSCPRGSISFDLIYGLPHQTEARFAETIEQTIALRPDRIAIYRYAHLPNRFKAQRLIKAERPALRPRIEMFWAAREALIESGYEAIGLDHFALPTDELSRAWKQGSLQRNFQGYSTRGGRDLIAVGPSAIGHVDTCYIQNSPSFKQWQTDVGQQGHAFRRGYVLDASDELHAAVIERIMCTGEVNLAAIAARHGVEWHDTFATEIQALHDLETQGLLEMEGSVLHATELGILALRQIAAVFDQHLRRGSGPAQYSKAL